MASLKWPGCWGLLRWLNEHVIEGGRYRAGGIFHNVEPARANNTLFSRVVDQADVPRVC